LADLAVLSISDNKLIIYRFQRGFLWGIRKEKRARSFVGENVKKLDGNVICFATVPSRRNRSKDHSSSVWTEL